MPPLEPAPRPNFILRMTNRWPLQKFRSAVVRLRRSLRSRALRDQLTGNPGLTLVHSGDSTWLGFKADRMSRTKARYANYRAVTELLTAADVPFFVVPSDTKRSAIVAVEEEHWPLFVRAVKSSATAPPVYLGIAVTHPDRGAVRWSVTKDSNIAGRALVRQNMIELFQVYSKGDGNGFYGRPEACKVQKWSRDSDGSLSAPLQNSRTSCIGPDWQVPATATVGAVAAPSYEPLVKQHVFEVDGQIDVVYLWVDGTDEVWRKRRDSIVQSLTGAVPLDSIDPSRFRDNGELRYSLRSIDQHCDWVRNIILVTDDQVPDWLDLSHPKLRHVTHKELFGEAGALPTYNSHAIAGRLHHIEGLSDRFLIFNDDVFVGHDVGPELFFTSNGMSKFFLSRATLPFSNAGAATHEAARRNVVSLLEKDFGQTATRAFFHTPVPQLRSLLFELEDRYSSIFSETWSSQLRSETDYEINGWLHHYYGYIQRRAIPGTITYDYFDLSDPQFIQRMGRLQKRRNAAAFCINDNPEAAPENVEYMSAWLEEYFPTPAPWESNK